MRRLVALSLVIGSVAAGKRAGAEPRIPQASGKHAKAASKGARGEKPAEPNTDEYLRLVTLADGDGDGLVTDTELASLVHEYVEKQARSRFARLDRDRDGRVTHAEVPRMDAARFARFDANGDGAFTVAELEGAVQAQALERCRAVLVKLDADGDGALSAADAETLRLARLSKEDGKLER